MTRQRILKGANMIRFNRKTLAFADDRHRTCRPIAQRLQAVGAGGAVAQGALTPLRTGEASTTTHFDTPADEVASRLKGPALKIIVIGGSGLIGRKLVRRLLQHGHDVSAWSTRSGVNTVTGVGLAEALASAEVVVDVTNSPSPEDQAAMHFFTTSGRTLLAAEKLAGVKHHLALSVVGADNLTESGYFRGKMMQENLIKGSGIPYTILRSTQFFEFIENITESGAAGNMIRLPPALVQPIASDDVTTVLAHLTVSAPQNGTIEVAGPEVFPLCMLVRMSLSIIDDHRQVIADAEARYFGLMLGARSLIPGDSPRVGPIHFEDWQIAHRGRARSEVESMVGL
jgi:uncharacterized protein YbjT (DUF2867 family)